MTSQTKQFETLYSFRWFTVTYELFEDGHKQIMSIVYDDLPLDISEIICEETYRRLYNHIVAAMDNNALEENKFVSLFEHAARISRMYNKHFYGIK